MKKGDKVSSIETGWTGIIVMPGTTIVQVAFDFATASGKKRTVKSAWRVSDLKLQQPASARRSK